ncbi:MAG: DUF1016 N-terminal domain-containing protein [Isosphaerales bacterium]
MTATHWEIGRRVIEYEQGGSERARYGEGMLTRLSEDLGHRFGRGFSLTNLKQFRKFFLLYRDIEKGQTDSDQFAHLSYPRNGQTVSDLLKPGLPMNATPPGAQVLVRRFPLPWSHYVQLSVICARTLGPPRRESVRRRDPVHVVPDVRRPGCYNESETNRRSNQRALIG